MLPLGMVMFAPSTARAPYLLLAAGPAASATGPLYEPLVRPKAPSQTAPPALATSSAAKLANGLPDSPAPSETVVWKYPNSLQDCQIHWRLEEHVRLQPLAEKLVSASLARRGAGPHFAVLVQASDMKCRGTQASQEESPCSQGFTSAM